MARNGSRGSKVLREIRRRFSRRRSEGRGAGHAVPNELRELALSALRGGHTAGQIAQAAGISGQSVVNWRRQMTQAAATDGAVELELIDGQKPASPEPGQEVAMARISLRSGVTVELPASMLESSLLLALNGSAL